MSPLFVAAMRAVPLALCLPLPGVAVRVAVGLVLASAGAGVPGSDGGEPLHELVIGLALGLAVAAPVAAARYAGRVIEGGLRARTRSLGLLFATLAWLVFGAAGGLSLLVNAYLGSYKRVPLGGGIELVARAGFCGLVADLALPALLALAVVELGAGILARFEDGADLPIGAQRLAHAARPLVALLLVVASLAAFSRGVSAATRTTAFIVTR